jgi:hypothetical protein
MPGWSFGTWARSNLGSLVVIVVAGSVLVGVTLGIPLYRNAVYQAPPAEVAKGETYEAAGYTWTLITSREFPHSNDNEAVPEGLAVTAALIKVKPGEHAEMSGTCNAELVDGDGPEARRWTTLSNPWDYNYGLLDDSKTTCQLEGEAFDLEIVYLTPEGTLSDAVLEVEIGVLGGELIRFDLTD